ncbi:hypothetical protein ACIBLA_23025 [Streptomyces sp. NPDC050433]|uniref:hypothetical protein n=1 Tax=Streptomyces sp. NPDC050433 TaxID=3365615 RepID=UPI0037B4D935
MPDEDEELLDVSIRRALWPPTPTLDRTILPTRERLPEMSDEDGLSPGARRMIEEAQAMMTEELLEETLRTKANVDPDNLATLLDLVAIGITNSTWRNSCVENWHAEGRLSDGEMMRINSHTTFRHLTEALDLNGTQRQDLRDLLLNNRPEQYQPPLWRIRPEA